MTYRPCLCGATDCSRCFPTCNDPTECCSCGDTVKQHMTIECRRCGNAVCETCADDGMCVECHKTATDEARLKRACAPRVGDVFEWRDSRFTVKDVAPDGTVGTLLECENWFMDSTFTRDGWASAVQRTLAHAGVTFTPALDNGAAGVVECATLKGTDV